jgi:release factor glutamine methyltransferase
MSSHFKERGIDSPRVSAEMLLASVLGCDRMRLYMEADRPASSEELSALRELVRRAARHEPVQYLVGHAWFFSRRFEVDRSTLIPRPSTESLVEEALRWLEERGLDAPAVLDLATGTGCIAISVAAQRADAAIVATDLVPAAIELARRNATALGVVERIDLRAGSLWEPLRAAETFDLILSNPPYISDAEWEEVPPNVREWEPQTALRGGIDGLALVRAVISGAGARLNPGGLLLVEIAASQEQPALRLAEEAGLRELAVHRDDEGLPRVLAGRR